MKLILKNLMEEIVSVKLESLIDSLDCCKCETCQLDIKSHALNHLPPKYVATTKGELLSKIDSLDASFNASIIASIVTASEVIKQNPRHRN